MLFSTKHGRAKGEIINGIGLYKLLIIQCSGLILLPQSSLANLSLTAGSERKPGGLREVSAHNSVHNFVSSVH